jgi:hypothetical protein
MSAFLVLYQLYVVYIWVWDLLGYPVDYLELKIFLKFIFLESAELD